MLTLLPVRKTGLNNRKKESVDFVRHSDLAWHVLGESVCKPESKLFLLKNAKKGVSKKVACYINLTVSLSSWMIGIDTGVDIMKHAIRCYS